MEMFENNYTIILLNLIAKGVKKYEISQKSQIQCFKVKSV